MLKWLRLFTLIWSAIFKNELNGPKWTCNVIFPEIYLVESKGDCSESKWTVSDVKSGGANDQKRTLTSSLFNHPHLISSIVHFLSKYLPIKFTLTQIAVQYRSRSFTVIKMTIQYPSIPSSLSTVHYNIFGPSTLIPTKILLLCFFFKNLQTRWSEDSADSGRFRDELSFIQFVISIVLLLYFKSLYDCARWNLVRPGRSGPDRSQIWPSRPGLGIW